jgi:threonine/homoserine/homoserine lactone efflux protein
MPPALPLTYFLQGAALGLSAAASPGPFQTYLISESLSGGWRRGAPVAFAPLITDLPIILFSLFVLNQLPPYFLRVVSLAGGLFVFYLAWGLWKSWRATAGVDEFEPASEGSSLRRGILANFLSPGPYLYWGLITGPILLAALKQSALDGASFLAGFYGNFILCLLGIALLFSQARRLGPRVARALLLASLIILVFFGSLLIWRGLVR